jgi:hypothetical protein
VQAADAASDHLAEGSDGVTLRNVRVERLPDADG